MIASKELDIEAIDYAIDYDSVMKNKGLAGMFNPVENIIIFNGDWLESANNNDILLLVFHEIRHFYQKKQIHLMNNGLFIKEDRQRVKAWEDEYSSYVVPNKTNRKLYLNQLIEKDAIDFSKSLLNKALALIK